MKVRKEIESKQVEEDRIIKRILKLQIDESKMDNLQQRK
jgi:hypothetical protein